MALGFWCIPLPGYDEQHAADPQVGEEDVHPDVGRQGVEEGEHAGVGPVGLAVQDADPQRHEGLGEVYRLLPNVGDGERSNGQISFLCATRGREEEGIRNCLLILLHDVHCVGVCLMVTSEKHCRQQRDITVTAAFAQMQ